MMKKKKTIRCRVIMDKGKKVLVVEDDILTSYWIVSELNKIGYYTYEPVTSGESAIESAIKNKPDFILMDVWLEGKINGIEAAEKILSSCDTSIIFMSGYPEEAFIKLNKKVKYRSYLHKPLQAYDLEDALQNAGG
jgi:CheY-like chemotaxis protein